MALPLRLSQLLPAMALNQPLSSATRGTSLSDILTYPTRRGASIMEGGGV